MISTLRQERRIAFASVILLAATTAFGSTYYVAYPGHFAPDGRVQYPFSHIRGAMCVVPEGSTIDIHSGNYREYGEFSTPMTLTTSSSDMVQIGKLPMAESELRVIAYNGHLDLEARKCKDQTRAEWFGWNFANSDYAPDVVGMEEVWSQDVCDTVYDNSGFTDRFYGKEKNGRVNNSGLLLMTQDTYLSNKDQESYEWGDDWDWFANKGYIRGTFKHDGFYVTMFVTHTQSGDSDDNQATRGRQMEQLAYAILAWRMFNPTHIVIAVGDFNVRAGDDEYFGSMDDNMGGIGKLLDIARNEGCGSWEHCTSCTDNNLKQRWGDDGKSDRLDYILTCPSYDGSVAVVAQDYEWIRMTIPSDQSSIPCGKDDAQTRHLSDHDGVFARLKLYQVK